MIRTLIVDDEPLAREGLRVRLSREAVLGRNAAAVYLQRKGAA